MENAGDERPEYLTHSLQFFFHAKNFKYKNQTPVNVSVVQIKKKITKFGDKNFVSLTRDDRFVKLDEKNEKNASGTSKFCVHPKQNEQRTQRVVLIVVSHTMTAQTTTS